MTALTSDGASDVHAKVRAILADVRVQTIRWAEDWAGGSNAKYLLGSLGAMNDWKVRLIAYAAFPGLNASAQDYYANPAYSLTSELTAVTNALETACVGIESKIPNADALVQVVDRKLEWKTATGAQLASNVTQVQAVTALISAPS